MKFLLVPLLIVGMFVSFTAALLAMLFFTKTIKSPTCHLRVRHLPFAVYCSLRGGEESLR